MGRRIISLMDAIPPNGKDFTTGIMKSLYWERHWVKWKAEGCKSFELAPSHFQKGNIDVDGIFCRYEKSVRKNSWSSTCV